MKISLSTCQCPVSFQAVLLISTFLFSFVPFLLYLRRDGSASKLHHVHFYDIHSHKHLRVIKVSLLHKDSSMANSQNSSSSSNSLSALDTVLSTFARIAKEDTAPLGKMGPLLPNPLVMLHLPLQERTDDDQPFLTYNTHLPNSVASHHQGQSSNAVVVNLTQVAWYYEQPYAFRLDVANQCMQHMYTDLTKSDILANLSRLTGFDLERRQTRTLYVYDCFELLRERYVDWTLHVPGQNESSYDDPDILYKIEEYVSSKGEYVQFNYTYRLYNHTAPPALPSSRQYVGRADILRAIAGHNNRMLEYIVDAGNGSAAAQDDDREVEASAGEVYVYAHNYAHPCFLHNISHKFVASCLKSGLSSEYVVDLLVVAVQRSGTHYLWEMLNQLYLDVHHEGIGPQGSVSWPFAVNAHDAVSYGLLKTLDQHRYYVLNNPTQLSMHRFRYVFHQVRHPIRVITTLVNKCGTFDRYWLWIATTSGFESIREDQTPLKRAMLLYYLWNRHMEMYADLRYVMERTSPRDVCLWSGFPLSHCTHTYRGEIKKAKISPISFGQSQTSQQLQQYVYNSFPHGLTNKELMELRAKLLRIKHTPPVSSKANTPSPPSLPKAVPRDAFLKKVQEYQQQQQFQHHHPVQARNVPPSQYAHLNLVPRSSMHPPGVAGFASHDAQGRVYRRRLTVHREMNFDPSVKHDYPQLAQEDPVVATAALQQPRQIHQRKKSGVVEGWNADKYNHPKLDIARYKRNIGVFKETTHQKDVGKLMSDITWEDMDKEDWLLAQKIRSMCLEYHMPLDPRDLPQSEDTRKFHA